MGIVRSALRDCLSENLTQIPVNVQHYIKCHDVVHEDYLSLLQLLELLAKLSLYERLRSRPDVLLSLGGSLENHKAQQIST